MCMHECDSCEVCCLPRFCASLKLISELCDVPVRGISGAMTHDVHAAASARATVLLRMRGICLVYERMTGDHVA